ncbi:MAG: hypothetical protein ABFS19_11680 [Thermodesulfobacteriota bacterium]
MAEQKRLDEIMATIEQMRDEVKLKAHLGKKETQDELELLEKKWQSFVKEYKPIAKEAGTAAENALAGLGLAADELKAGFDRIRKRL